MNDYARSRRRLFTRLDEAHRSPLVLVVGPRRSGKTSGVAEYLANRRVEHVRVQVTSDVTSPAAMLDLLTASLVDVLPGMRMSSILAARRNNTVSDITSFVEWGSHHLREIRTTIVLDDADALSSHSSCVLLLDALIRATAANIKWILIMRDPSDFPTVRWLTDGLCTLQIDARGLGAGSASDAVPDDAVYDAVLNAAMESLDEDLRLSFLAVALYCRFTPDMVPSGLLMDGAAIRRWAAAGIIVQDGADTYEFNHRIRARAIQRAGGLTVPVRADLFETAARVLEARGRWRESVNLRLVAGDPATLVRAIEVRGFRAIENGDAITLRRAFDALDEHEIIRHPVALAVKAAMASADDRQDISEAWYRMAVLGSHGEERDGIVLRFGLDLVRWGRDDAAKFLEDEIARGAGDRAGTAQLNALLATAYVLQHRKESARTSIRRALAVVETITDVGMRARIYHQAAYVALNDDDLVAAKDFARQALTLARSVYFFDLAARALSVLHNVAVASDDPAAAREFLSEMEDLAHKAGSSALLMYALLNLYEIEVNAGNLEALTRIERELKRLHVLLTSMVSESLLPAQAMRAAWTGRFDHAVHLLASSAEKQFGEERRGYRFAETALYAAAAGQRTISVSAIRKSRNILRSAHQGESMTLQAHAFLCLAEMLLGPRTRSTRSLDALSTMARYAGPRARALVECVGAVWDRWAHGVGADVRLAHALDRLETVEFGGIARLVEALPIPEIRVATSARVQA